MNLKEQLKKDFNIFINPEEFAEIHRIDGKNLNIVVDDDKLEERKNKNFNGVSVEEVLYYVKADDLGELPSVGSSQKFDGRYMFVTSARNANGMYEIILGQSRGE